MRQDKTMIEQSRTKQENWMRVDQGELDNHTEWLAVTELGAF